MTDEIWKNISGFEGYYQISNLGRVKSMSRTIVRSNGWPMTFSERIRKASDDCCVYLQVGLSVNGKKFGYKIHRLVAEMFVPKLYDFPEVNHMDEVKYNNHASNLEWCTHAYNNNYGTRNLRTSISNLNKKGKKVTGLHLENNKRVDFPSAVEPERQLKICHTNIIKCCKGQRAQAGGYK